MRLVTDQHSIRNPRGAIPFQKFTLGKPTRRDFEEESDLFMPSSGMLARVPGKTTSLDSYHAKHHQE